MNLEKQLNSYKINLNKSVLLQLLDNNILTSGIPVTKNENV